MTTIRNALDSLYSNLYYNHDNELHGSFVDTLEAIINEHGEAALAQIESDAQDRTRRDKDGVHETLRHMGHIETSYAEPIRLMLERVLSSDNSPRVHDACLLSLASLDNPASLPVLRMFQNVTRFTSLKEDCQRIIEQLEATVAER